jgi:transposase
LREQLRAELVGISAEQVVSLDERGMDNNEARAYGWSPQGEPCGGEKPGHRTLRVSLLDALHQYTLSAPFGFEGSCTTVLFDAYSEHCLVPVLKPGQIVIYDNASFPQSAKARHLIEEAGCTQKFLPPYSPDLNPIEHCWFPLKQRIRKYLPLYDRDLHKTIDAVLNQQQIP